MHWKTGKLDYWTFNLESYEAYVIYIFLQLLIQYMGDEPVIFDHLEKKV